MMGLLRIKRYLICIGICLIVFVLIIVVSMVSFGIEADAVIEGYNSTRSYARSAKNLEVSVDTYKDIMDTKIEDVKRRENSEPSVVASLGSYGTLLTPEEYEAYTATLSISNDSALYNKAGGDIWPTSIRSAAAKYSPSGTNVDPLNFLTTDNLTCGGIEEKELKLYSAWQCAAFADWYVNQVSYKDYVDCFANYVVTGSSWLNVYTDIVRSGTCWVGGDGEQAEANVGARLKDSTGNLAKSFFQGVTPGTMVRQYQTTDDWHSYIILGADDQHIVLYDCNWSGGDSGHKCGIKIRELTWEQFGTSKYTAGCIILVVAPPNTSLPQGCLDKSDPQGHIVGGEE